MAKVNKRAALVGYFLLLSNHKVLLFKKCTQYQTQKIRYNNDRKLQPKAVLFGCNSPHTKYRLHWYIEDVKPINGVIKDRFGFCSSLFFQHGFHEINIQVLTCDGAAVLEAGKPFRQDEVIMLCDSNLVSYVYLRRLVNRLLQGAVIEKEKEQIGASEKRIAPENPPKAKFHPHFIGGEFELDPQQENEGIILSGCEADETSYDIVSGDRAYGAFTDAVVTFLNRHHLCATVSNGDLQSGAAKALEEQGFEQNPCLYCSDKNKYQPFLGGFA